MSADASDLSLVRRVQRGDKGAFDALVLKYQHKLVKLVMRYVRNPAEAEDIAQEAFIKAYRALPQFRGDSAFYTWLYRIAINTAKNAVVSRDRSPIEYDLDRSNEESYDMQGRMKDSETPEGLVLTEEIRSTVNAAIEALNEELDSQLSAMFDDELAPEQCELLARRLSRDEQLKARWGRYAVIGAAIRSERGVRLNAPLAGRVSAVLLAEPALVTTPGA